jgi:hypothetical protein
MSLLSTTSGAIFISNCATFKVKSTGGAASTLYSKSDMDDPNWSTSGVIEPGFDYVAENSATKTIYKIDAGAGATIRAWDAA